jgi:hypothetical protein
MARRRRSSGGVKVVRVAAPRQSAPIIRVSAPGGGRRWHRVRNHARGAGRAVASEKHTLAALAAAGAYGLIEKSGVAIPTIGPLGPAATVGMAAWLYGRFSKNQTAQHVATGLLCVAINRWAATGTIAGESYYEDDGG